MFGFKPSIASQYKKLSGVNLTLRHRILFVGNFDGSMLFGYDMILPLECFAGGYLCECASYGAFVNNAIDWSKQFDILVVNTHCEIAPYEAVTSAQVKTAIQTFMTAGVKLLLFTGDAGARISKWSATGTQTFATLFDIIGCSGQSDVDFHLATGTFQHGTAYPFGTTEILSTPTPTPTNTYLKSLNVTDPEVIIAIQAIQGETVGNCVLYKPGEFFVVVNGGTAGATIDIRAYWKYVKGNVLCDILLSKTSNVRVALDSQNGRKIAALGIDCDNTSDLVAIQALRNAFGNAIPMEWGIVANKVTDDIAGFYRSLSDYNRICSHGKYHYDPSQRVTIIDELHTIPQSQLIRVKRPFKANLGDVGCYVKTTDDLTTFTKKSGSLSRTAPTAGQYLIDVATDASSSGESVNGWLKFHADDVGKNIKITYTCCDEASEVLGSFDALKSKGCLSNRAYYTTYGFHSINSDTYLRAKDEGVVICDHTTLPCFGRVWTSLHYTGDKWPFPCGVTMMYQIGSSALDVIWFLETKDNAKTNIFTPAITLCNTMELPFMFYMHDFLISETYNDGVWVDSGAKYNADWKKIDFATTQAYIADMYTWVIAELQTVNPYWMTRSEYVSRYTYLNRYLQYDVKNSGSGYRISIINTGKEIINGLTFRVPLASAPSVVNLLNGGDVDYIYINATVTAWFDLPAGQSTVLEVL